MWWLGTCGGVAPREGGGAAVKMKMKIQLDRRICNYDLKSASIIFICTEPGN